MVKEVNNAPESYDNDNDNVVHEDETAVVRQDNQHLVWPLNLMSWIESARVDCAFVVHCG